MTHQAQASSFATASRRPRQTEVLRNIDDTLRVFNLLTLKSCGLVVLVYAGCYSAELTLRLFTMIFGPLASLAQFVVAGMAGAALSWVERHEDEHFVPSAIDYFRQRPWRIIYSSGLAQWQPCAAMERVLRGD